MVASERPAPRHVPRTHRPPFPGPRGARGGRTGGRTGGVQGAYRGWVTSRGPFLLGTPPSDPRPPSCRSRHPIGIRRPPVFRGFTQSHAEREGDRRGGHLPEDGGFPSRRSFGGSARPGDGIVGGRESPREREPARFRPPFRTEGGEGAADGRLVGFSQGRQTLRRGLPPPHGGAGRFSSGFFATGPPARSPERREGGVA